ncbi:hypothetical protein D9M70_563340 [compost metagenome]
MSSIGLVNMSASESFGIVLLEAWLADKPVIVNKGCAAFHDMATDGVNALMCDVAGLDAAIRRLVSEPELRNTLSANGRQTAATYDWSRVGEAFIEFCNGLVS